MRTYLLKRLLLMIPTLFGVSVVVWAIVTGAPEPPISQQVPTTAEAGAGAAGGVPQAVKVFRAQYGLDKPKILNRYYALDAAEVRRTLETAVDVEGTRSIKDKARASEQLIKWGEYSVPALLSIVKGAEGRLKDEAMAWLVKNAQRVPVGEGGRVAPAVARRNAAIVRENEIVGLCRWTPDADPALKAAAIEAFEAWYQGARGTYAGGADAAEVARAVDAQDGATLERLGASAVPALADLATGGDAGRRDRAIAWFTRLARVPEGGGESAALRNRTIEKLSWNASDPEPQKEGCAEVLRTWWRGTAPRWEHSGLRKLQVLFLETQFATYWRNLLRFDLGQSMTHKVPVTTLILERLKYSLTLALSSLVLAYLIAVPAGILSAKIHGSLAERAQGFVFFALYSLPSFYVATLMIRYLAKDQPGSWEVIPAARFEDLDAWRLPSWAWLKDIGWHIVGPIACMTYGTFAALSRYAKTGLLHVIRSDYVRTARAKGLGEFAVTVKHAARNGIIPLVTLLGTTLPVIVSGNFIIEVIFSIPGFGQLTLQAIWDRDYSVIVGVDLVIAVLTMIGILLSDLLYVVVDPRISYS